MDLQLEIGKRYTVYRIDSMMAMTHADRITVKRIEENGDPIYSTQRHPRTLYRMRLHWQDYQNGPDRTQDAAVFEGWEQPYRVDTERTDTPGMHTMSGNACFNFVGDPAGIRAWIESKQLNPNFRKDHALAHHDGQETPVFPEMDTDHAVINRLKGSLA